MQARASGADAILLIAAVLPNSDITYFCKAAASLGMVCLVEVHTEAELARVLQADGIDSQILGINNRDLGTFEVPPTTPPPPRIALLPVPQNLLVWLHRAGHLRRTAALSWAP